MAFKTVKKYILMTENEIQAMEEPAPCRKKESVMNDYLNIIYKMLLDGMDGKIIYYYILEKGYKGNKNTLMKYIYLINQNNFPGQKMRHTMGLTENVYPEGVIVVKTDAILRCLLTVNPKSKKEEKIIKNLEVIKKRYRVCEYIEKVYADFYAVIMGEDPDKLDKFLKEYETTAIKGFCEGIKKDIAPVKNAISYNVSSGFVEGNNNKFKLIKRILYGRAGLVNLSKKCKLAFCSKDDHFNLYNLI